METEFPHHYTGLEGLFDIDGEVLKCKVISENCFIRRDKKRPEPICYIRIESEDGLKLNLSSTHFDELHNGGTVAVHRDVMQHGSSYEHAKVIRPDIQG